VVESLAVVVSAFVAGESSLDANKLAAAAASPSPSTTTAAASPLESIKTSTSDILVVIKINSQTRKETLLYVSNTARRISYQSWQVPVVVMNDNMPMCADMCDV
jgi:hypothetical protein